MGRIGGIKIDGYAGTWYIHDIAETTKGMMVYFLYPESDGPIERVLITNTRHEVLSVMDAGEIKRIYCEAVERLLCEGLAWKDGNIAAPRDGLKTEEAKKS